MGLEVLKLKEWKSVLEFEYGQGQLTISMDWETSEGEQMEEEIETLRWNNILLLRDFLNKIAPADYKAKPSETSISKKKE